MRCRTILLLALVGCARVAMAINDPPYCLFSYEPDETDDPPLYYTKVCPVGKTEEKDAEYVVIGIWLPRTYQGVAPNYSGELVIPEKIDGLPVRKIMPAAFSMCQSLTSVHIPSSVREIGERAFSWCTSLTNVTFKEGVTTIGDAAFTNCISLQSVTFPKSLSYLGPGCFERCESLEFVKFQGDAPRLDTSYDSKMPYLGEKFYSYNGISHRFKVLIPRATFGWIRPYASGIPEKWPVDFGWMNAYPVEGYEVEKRGLVMTITSADE